MAESEKKQEKDITTLKKLFALLTLCLTLPACVATKEPVKMPENAILLDIRTESEYKAGHIEGAVLVPHEHIKLKIGKIAPNKTTPLYLYCRSGRRVKLAIKDLQDLGYKNLHDLGGMEDARKALKK